MFPILRFVAGLIALSPPISTAEPVPGRSIFGSKAYVEYIAGDLPLVISSPHGGRLKPPSIPTRTTGKVDIDMNTQELLRSIGEAVHAQTGHHAHLIICRLHRSKLDANRDIGEAAAGNPDAETAWNEYHAFIEQAQESAIAKFGKVFYIDLHGQGHPDRRIELGYLHSVETLSKSEAELNGGEIAEKGSLRKIAAKSKALYTDLLRGSRSLGALLEARGFPCAPSPERPVPVLPFFEGGYSTRRHVAASAPAAGLQVECNFKGVRDTADNRSKFAAALVESLREYLGEWFEIKLPRR